MARPTELDTVTAQPGEGPEVRALLEHLDADGDAVSLRDSVGHEVEVPPSVSRLLTELVRELACGNAVTIVPTRAELTTQQAADLLNVSRPYLVRLLEAKEIPCGRVGTHRRVLLADVLEYKRHRDEHRETVLRRMGEEATGSGLEY
jgi:excisionase family DNA binding protein